MTARGLMSEAHTSLAAAAGVIVAMLVRGKMSKLQLLAARSACEAALSNIRKLEEQL